MNLAISSVAIVTPTIPKFCIEPLLLPTVLPAGKSWLLGYSQPQMTSKRLICEDDYCTLSKRNMGSTVFKSGNKHDWGAMRRIRKLLSMAVSYV
uniref:Uncharacterized protein n=1 Tax=Ciona intestinalis TaxID=7719 RepID=H2Y2P1_CIOIN